MSKYKFHKEEESKSGKVFLVLNYMSGDADGDFPEEIELENVTFSKNLELPEEHSELIKQYKLVSTITNCNHKNFLEDYKEIEKKFDRNIANLWDSGKNDPQTDYSTKCHLNEIILRGYDEDGSKYETYDLK